MNLKIIWLIAILAILLCGCAGQADTTPTSQDPTATNTLPADPDDITRPFYNGEPIELPEDEFDDDAGGILSSRPLNETEPTVTEPPVTQPSATQPTPTESPVTNWDPDTLPEDVFE